MELDYKAIGKRIKIARIKKNLTQEAIADKIGITPQHVSNIETGNASVSLTTLVAIANTLTVSVNDLLCDTVLISKAVFEKEAKRITKANDIQVIDKAILPQNPIKPNKMMNMAIAAVLGAMIGLFVVFLIEYLDNKLKTPQDIEKHLGLSVLGVVPNEKLER